MKRTTEEKAAILLEAIETMQRLNAEVGNLNGSLRRSNAERDLARDRLSQLLARIHRDGGQREGRVGTGQAVTEADDIVARLFVAYAESERQMEYGVKQHEAAQDAIRERDAALALLREAEESVRHSVCAWYSDGCDENAKEDEQLLARIRTALAAKGEAR